MTRSQGLWAGAALLACVVVAELLWPAGRVKRPPPRPAVVAPAAVARPASQNGALVATLLERPLFTPDRRPVAGAPAAVAETEEPPRLAGILVTGDRRSALFASGDGRAVLAQEGSHIGAFEVRAIKAGEVELAGPAGPRVVRPSFAKGDASLDNQTHFQATDTNGVVLGLLPRPPVTDTRPFNQMTSPSGAAIFRNAPVAAGDRK